MWERLPTQIRDSILKYSRKAEADATLRERQKKTKDWLLLGHTIQYGFDRLIPYAAVLIGLLPDELIERVSVSVGRNPSVNGHMAFIPWNGTCKIEVYTGLTYFYPALARNLVMRFGIKDKGTIVQEPLALSGRGAAMRGLFLAFWNNATHDEYVKHVFEMAQLDKVRMVEAVMLGAWCKYFVVAHELGHAIAALASNGVGTCDGLDHLFGVNWVKILDGSEGEILADQIAVLLFSGLCQVEKDRPCIIYGWVSSQLVFIVEEMLREFHTRYFGRPPTSSGSHPPSEIRLKILRASLANNRDLIEVGGAFERICGDLLAEASD